VKESEDFVQDEQAGDEPAGADRVLAAEGEDIERLQMDLADAKDRALRAQAELENFRKRIRRDTDEQLKYANASLMRDLLPVVDNLRRAIESASKAGESGGVVEGVQMVADQLENVLAKHHCNKIEAAGAEFDPNRHEAALQQASETIPPGHVSAVLQEGYALHDRVLRPAQVIVSNGPAK
jgi:molecular chaperone GrpE